MKLLIAALFIPTVSIGFIVGCIIHPFIMGYQGATERLENLIADVVKRRDGGK